MHESVSNSVSVNSFHQYSKIQLIGDGPTAHRCQSLINDIYPGKEISFSEDLPKDSPFLLTLGFNHFVKRKAFVEEAQKSKLEYPSLVHPQFDREESVSLGFGNIILGFGSAGVKSSLRDHCLVFPGVIIEPYVRCYSNVILGPGVIVCEDSVIEDNVFLGAGAIVLPGVTVGRGSVIGAGSLLRTDVREGEKVVGVPGRRLD